MKRLIFIVCVSALVLAFAAPAFAYTPPVTSGTPDPQMPAADDPNCQVCHGPVSGPGFLTPGTQIKDSTPTSATLRNIIRFKNRYVLDVMKVETSGTSGPPNLDFGDVDPSQTYTKTFYTKVFSNARYYETFSWSAFPLTGGGYTIPASALAVTVNDGYGYQVPPFPPGDVAILNGTNHPNFATGNELPYFGSPGFTHAPHISPANWEKISLALTVPPSAWAGVYQGTINIKVTQI